MNVSLDVIMDGLAAYKPVVHKICGAEAEYRRFCHYDDKLDTTDPQCLYVLNSRQAECLDRGDAPRHVIVAADTFPRTLEDKIEGFDTLIHIPGGISAAAVVQAGHLLFESYETWYQALLLAVIQHKPIKGLLEIAAEKLTNPLALFDNAEFFLKCEFYGEKTS
jgi:hypothetical protein